MFSTGLASWYDSWIVHAISNSITFLFLFYETISTMLASVGGDRLFQPNLSKIYWGTTRTLVTRTQTVPDSCESNEVRILVSICVSNLWLSRSIWSTIYLILLCHKTRSSSANNLIWHVKHIRWAVDWIGSIKTLYFSSYRRKQTRRKTVLNKPVADAIYG